MKLTVFVDANAHKVSFNDNKSAPVFTLSKKQLKELLNVCLCPQVI